MNKLIVGLVIGLSCVATFALATSNPYANATFQSGAKDVQPCLMYGLQTDGSLYPVLVNASGAVKTF